MKKKLHAIVLGATGATGQELVKQLLYNSNFSEISVFTRKIFSMDHEKLNKNKIDFFLDIGSCWGVYSLRLAGIHKNLKILAFDPIKTNIERLIFIFRFTN